MESRSEVQEGVYTTAAIAESGAQSVPEHQRLLPPPPVFQTCCAANHEGDLSATHGAVTPLPPPPQLFEPFLKAAPAEGVGTVWGSPQQGGAVPYATETDGALVQGRGRTECTGSHRYVLHL